MGKEEALIMESWTPLSASRQWMGWGERPWELSGMGKRLFPGKNLSSPPAA